MLCAAGVGAGVGVAGKSGKRNPTNAFGGTDADAVGVGVGVGVGVKVAVAVAVGVRVGVGATVGVFVAPGGLGVGRAHAFLASARNTIPSRIREANRGEDEKSQTLVMA